MKRKGTRICIPFQDTSFNAFKEGPHFQENSITKQEVHAVRERGLSRVNFLNLGFSYRQTNNDIGALH